MNDSFIYIVGGTREEAEQYIKDNDLTTVGRIAKDISDIVGKRDARYVLILVGKWRDNQNSIAIYRRARLQEWNIIINQ